MTDSGLPPARRLWERVEQLRAARGWTTLELEKRSGVDRSTVSRWKNGKRSPLPEKVIAVADALGVPRDTLLQIAGHAVSPMERAVRDEISGPLAIIGDDETDELLERLSPARRRLLEQVRESERERLEREAAEASRRFADLVRSEATQSEPGNNG
jgi:transcriptional regulator with XRE-family HTH domain